MESSLISNDGEIDQSAELLKRLNDICMNDDSKSADKIFVVEDTKIPVHTQILSARSSYFESLLNGGFSEAKQDEIPLNVPLKAFRAILKYIYTGQMSLAAFECDEIMQVYDLANQYGFDSLKATILDHLTPKLKLDNCVAIWNAALLYSLDDLQNACLRFMESNSIKLLGHETFKDLPPSSLCALLERDSFYAPEIKILKAICNWYTSNSSADIKEVLSKTVRLSQLSIKDFRDVVFQSKIMNQKELTEFMIANVDNEAACRIPSSAIDDEKNIATHKHGAKTISGENSPKLLDGIFTSYGINSGCTYSTMESLCIYDVNNRNQRLSSSIIVDLGVVKFINYMEMLLMDKDARSYTYYIETSLDGKIYTRLFDYTKEYRRSWQYLYFESLPIRFIKLVGTQTARISSKRKGFFPRLIVVQDYDSFEVVGLKAMYKTTNIPKLIDGVIVPTKNVATVECGACVVDGIGGNNMLNVKMDDFTCHEKSSFIQLQLNQPYVIGSLRMLLGNSLNRSNKYSFYIETITNGPEWEIAVDKRDEILTGWQEFDFEPRPANFIRITGTQSDIKFICTYFECPRNLRKPRLEHSRS